ncbi:t-box transcription factor TBX20 [Trichonephila clavipes]|nr:t-box transcription factor TBX20 [Trichonephila clavipes]
MFPTLRISFTGLDFCTPSGLSAKYAVLLDIVPVDQKRYRYAYHRSSWLVAGKADPPSPARLYTHPDCPYTADQLRKQVVSFEKVKLTNNEMDKQGHIVLNSMHKYQPRIHLVLLRQDSHGSVLISDLEQEKFRTYIFPETVFTAVTAYQNQLVAAIRHISHSCLDPNDFTVVNCIVKGHASLSPPSLRLRLCSRFTLLATYTYFDPKDFSPHPSTPLTHQHGDNSTKGKEDIDDVSSVLSNGDGDRFNSCQVIYSQFGLAIHQNDHQARRRFVEWAQNEIAVVPDSHKRILFSDEAHFWLNGYVNKQNCRIWSEANPQVYVETPLHPEKLNCWVRFMGWWNPSSKTMKATTLQSMAIGIEP